MAKSKAIKYHKNQGNSLINNSNLMKNWLLKHGNFLNINAYRTSKLIWESICPCEILKEKRIHFVIQFCSDIRWQHSNQRFFSFFVSFFFILQMVKNECLHIILQIFRYTLVSHISWYRLQLTPSRGKIKNPIKMYLLNLGLSNTIYSILSYP